MDDINEKIPGLSPEPLQENDEQDGAGDLQQSLGGDELSEFESADIEEAEFVSSEQVVSVVESALFSSDRPVSVSTLRQAFSGTNVKSRDIRRALEQLRMDYANPIRGVTLEEINNAYQLRTKVDNMKFLRRLLKGRVFKLSGPALEALSIVAYKQPCTKAQVDEIRGVESGHLLRGLMDRGIVHFEGRSDLPGKPMFYGTTRKFLEIFGLRNLQELPSLQEIDQLLPDGMDEVEQDEETLGDLTGALSKDPGAVYSEGEDELLKITDQLSGISTSSEFFEEERRRQRERRDLERAQNIRDALTVGEAVEEKELKWLERYDKSLSAESLGDAPLNESTIAESAVLGVETTESTTNLDKLEKDLLIFSEDAPLESPPSAD